MIKKIFSPFRSLKVITFLTDILLFTLASIILIAAAVSFEKANHINEKTDEIEQYCGDLSRKIYSNAYLANNSENSVISQEMSLVADKYDGRIIIIDSNLRCILDTYNIETDKTYISSDVIKALKNSSGIKTDDSKKLIQLFYPINPDDNNTEENTSGVIVFIFSVEKEYAGADRLGKILILIAIPCFALVFCLAIFHSRYISNPIIRITSSLNQISEGYADKKIEVKNFRELENMAEAFDNMIDRLTSLENSRQEFVSNVSHELKTPLTSIKILADSLVMQPDASPEVYREFLGDINSEIDRENRIISDLLELVKLDRKNGEMHIAMVSINELMEILMKRMKPIAQSRNVELVFESYRKIDAEIDEVKMMLAISNLVENAIKYNKDAGRVKVTLDSDHKYFTLIVSDTGIGIPEDSLGLIFDRFYRVDKMRARKTGGTGLGLSIAKSVVLLHNGQLRVESKEGEGTTFTMRIPISFSGKSDKE